MLLKFLEILNKYISLLLGYGLGGYRFSIYFEIKNILKFFKNEKNLLLIDVGGNVGEYSRKFLKQKKNSHIYIIEPSTYNYAILKKKFANLNNVNLFKYAISNVIKKSKLYYNKRGSALSSLTNRLFPDHKDIKFIGSETVKVITLSFFLKKIVKIRRKIDILKIDIEGEELNCLNGLKKDIKRIKLIQFEFGGCNIDTREFFLDFYTFFKKNNFTLYRSTMFGLKRIENYSISDENFLTTNFIAVNTLFSQKLNIN
jgi:FkbM family methyltransferase